MTLGISSDIEEIRVIHFIAIFNSIEQQFYYVREKREYKRNEWERNDNPSEY